MFCVMIEHVDTACNFALIMQYECQINALREKVANARQQLQQNNKKKETFQAKSVLQNTSNEKAEQDLAHCW